MIDRNSSYTFYDYFKMNIKIEDLVAFFGYTLTRERLILPQQPMTVDLTDFKQEVQQSYKFINFNNEGSRREFLIAPVLLKLTKYTSQPIRISVEEAIEVNNLLKGTLDYYITSQRNLVIIEAKDVDLVRGMKQLATELIALDLLPTQQEMGVLYGAVSIGEDWRFMCLDRNTKLITEDLKLYRVPEEVELLLAILLGLLSS